jgi:hypothetical protein
VGEVEETGSRGAEEEEAAGVVFNVHFVIVGYLHIVYGRVKVVNLWNF